MKLARLNFIRVLFIWLLICVSLLSSMLHSFCTMLLLSERNKNKFGSEGLTMALALLVIFLFCLHLCTGGVFGLRISRVMLRGPTLLIITLSCSRNLPRKVDPASVSQGNLSEILSYIEEDHGDRSILRYYLEAGIDIQPDLPEI